VAIADIGLHHDVTLGIHAVYLDRAVDAPELGDAGQRHAAASGQAQAQGLEIGRRVEQGVGPAQDDRHASALFDDGADIAAFEQGFQVVLDVVDIEPETAGGQTVDRDLQVLHAVVFQREGIFGARHLLDGGDDLAGQV